jgi:hypothetical protein
VLKRFISEDPIRLEGGLNVYQYVEGDPVSFSDPSGLQAQAVAICAVWPVGTAMCGATAVAIGWAMWSSSHPPAAPPLDKDKVCNPAIPDVTPKDSCEYWALAEAKAGAGTLIMDNLGDAPRLNAIYGPGPWVKFQHVKNCPGGKKVVIHYFKSLSSLQNVELKIVNYGSGTWSTPNAN